MDADTVDGALREFVKRATARAAGRIRSITLFGSWARCGGGPGSDIDVFVVVDRRDPELTAAIHDAALGVDLERLTYLSVKICPAAKLDEMRRLGDPLLVAIEREGRALWIPTSRDASATE